MPTAASACKEPVSVVRNRYELCEDLAGTWWSKATSQITCKPRQARDLGGASMQGLPAADRAFQ